MSETQAAGQPLARLHAIIEGRVQGVGFRAFVQTIAADLGLTGWVRNRWDSSVEVVAEGEEARLNRLEAALRRGPSGAYVTDVHSDRETATGEFRRFSVRMTE